MDKRREARIAEYVDSPRLRLRSRTSDGRGLQARVDGDYCNYKVWCDPKILGHGGCTCPVGHNCKHVEALRRTWEVNPESFYVRPSPESSKFPADRLVFQDSRGAYAWSCPCGRWQGASVPSKAVALKEARKHLQSHVEGSKEWQAEQQWLKDRLHYEAEDQRIENAKRRALDLFRSKRFRTMADAALAAADEADLAGDQEFGEVANLFAALESEGKVESLWQWARPKPIRRTLRQAKPT
ncbi:MAG: hypothetical protein QOI63_1976 [Thermoplasmata archaeon]|nr:hypothetical protein [Thermoplasmata archaeon]